MIFKLFNFEWSVNQKLAKWKHDLKKKINEIYKFVRIICEP